MEGEGGYIGGMRRGVKRAFHLILGGGGEGESRDRQDGGAGGVQSRGEPTDKPADEEKEEPQPPDEFLCCITKELMRDPIILETGMSYERRSIEEWLDRAEKPTCPKTGQELNLEMLRHPLIPNLALRVLIADWRKSNNLPELEPLEKPLRGRQAYTAPFDSIRGSLLDACNEEDIDEILGFLKTGDLKTRMHAAHRLHTLAVDIQRHAEDDERDMYSDSDSDFCDWVAQIDDIVESDGIQLMIGEVLRDGLREGEVDSQWTKGNVEYSRAQTVVCHCCQALVKLAQLPVDVWDIGMEISRVDEIPILLARKLYQIIVSSFSSVDNEWVVDEVMIVDAIDDLRPAESDNPPPDGYDDYNSNRRCHLHGPCSLLGSSLSLLALTMSNEMNSPNIDPNQVEGLSIHALAELFSERITSEMSDISMPRPDGANDFFSKIRHLMGLGFGELQLIERATHLLSTILETAIVSPSFILRDFFCGNESVSSFMSIFRNFRNIHASLKHCDNHAWESSCNLIRQLCCLGDVRTIEVLEVHDFVEVSMNLIAMRPLQAVTTWREDMMLREEIFKALAAFIVNGGPQARKCLLKNDNLKKLFGLLGPPPHSHYFGFKSLVYVAGIVYAVFDFHNELPLHEQGLLTKHLKECEAFIEQVRGTWYQDFHLQRVVSVLDGVFIHGINIHPTEATLLELLINIENRMGGGGGGDGGGGGVPLAPVNLNGLGGGGGGGRSPVDQAVIAFFNQSGASRIENGYSIQEAQEALRQNFNAAMVKHSIFELAQSGNLYSTIDDEHFKSTEV